MSNTKVLSIQLIVLCNALDVTDSTLRASSLCKLHLEVLYDWEEFWI